MLGFLTGRTRKQKPLARFSRSWWRKIAGVVALAIGLGRLLLGYAEQPQPTRPVEGYYWVQRVIDGDTLLLDGQIRVRLQGIDTPETVKPDHPVEPWGPEASAFTKEFIRQANGQVRLTFGAERIDPYGRWLAFVWDNDQMLNEQLVLAGYAQARLDYRYSGRMKRRLQKAQDEARDARRRLWSSPLASQ